MYIHIYIYIYVYIAIYEIRSEGTQLIKSRFKERSDSTMTPPHECVQPFSTIPIWFSKDNRILSLPKLYNIIYRLEDKKGLMTSYCFEKLMKNDFEIINLNDLVIILLNLIARITRNSMNEPNWKKLKNKSGRCIWNPVISQPVNFDEVTLICWLLLANIS
jgi:hypothetical protein